MKAVVKRGMGVFVWPKSLGDYNDINDLVLGENYTQEELTSLIDSNTFQGSMAYLKMAKWRKKFGQKTRLEESSNYHLTEYKFFDQHDEEIKL